MRRFGAQDRPIYVISIAAELAGVHPQTLRVYERKGLLRPKRTEGNSRRYSERDIQILRRIQELTNEGLNLAGVMRVMALEQEMDELRADLERAMDQVERLSAQIREAIDARDAASIVPFREVRRVRRAMKMDVVERSRRRPFVAPAAPDPDNQPQTEEE